MTYDPRMRFRVWVGARLMEEAWIDATNPEAQRHYYAMNARHHELVNAAIRDDKPWMVEIYDPARPEAEAYVRIGTDYAGMGPAPRKIGRGRT